MLLHVNPGLGEVPGFADHDKQQLLHSVELRRQQLETDIQHYIQLKQHELRSYEQELLEQHRPPHHGTKDEEAETEEKKKKHTRVQKRERELYGLITPVFLPLMESPPTPKREKKAKQERADDASYASVALPSRGAEQAKEVAKPAANMSTPAEPSKKARRPSKKSALRSNNTPRNRRKRVSLVIDDQIVLPADTIVEPPPTSPSETTSTSNSTASLDECIDPRLTHIEALSQDPAHLEAVHHSLPVTMTHHSSSPTKSPQTTLPSAPMSLDSDSPPTHMHMHTPFESTPARIDDIPEHSSYPTTTITTPNNDPHHHDTDSDLIPAQEQDFSTYVGGINGSGTSDVNQAGSYGYPSSLGASYLESYMMSRPLSVRMAAAEKAELGREEKRALLEKTDDVDDEEDKSGGRRGGGGGGNHDDDDDFMGSMDDF